jgi:hypothetical protein
MKRTRASVIVAWVLGALVVGLLLELALAAAGRSILLPPASLALALVLCAIVVFGLAWPIRKSTRGAVDGKPRKPVNPFMAVRVAALAKASAYSGALLLGAAGGLGLYLLTRSVAPAVASVWLTIGMAFGAAVLLVSGLVAEHFCTLPPDDDEDSKRGEVRA